MFSFSENLFFQTNSLQDLFSSLNAEISTNESSGFITGHMIYNLAYTQIFQTTTTLETIIDMTKEIQSNFQEPRPLQTKIWFRK